MSRCRHGIGTVGGCRYCLVGLGADMVPPIAEIACPIERTEPSTVRYCTGLWLG